MRAVPETVGGGLRGIGYPDTIDRILKKWCKHALELTGLLSPLDAPKPDLFGVPGFNSAVFGCVSLTDQSINLADEPIDLGFGVVVVH